MKRLLAIITLLFLFFSCFASPAGRDIYFFNSQAKRAQFNSLTKQLRCLVCQNENLADSGASLAIDLRNKIYTQVKEGKTNAQIIDYMVSRYGDFILFKPPVEKETYLLWFGPFVLLFFGFIVTLIISKKH